MERGRSGADVRADASIDSADGRRAQHPHEERCWTRSAVFDIARRAPAGGQEQFVQHALGARSKLVCGDHGGLPLLSPEHMDHAADRYLSQLFTNL